MSTISDVTRWKLSRSHSAAGGDELPVRDVVGERAVRRAQGARVVVEARKDAARAPAPRLGSTVKLRGERQRALLEALDARAARREAASVTEGPPGTVSTDAV